VTSTAHRFVIALSARDRDTLVAHARVMADYLDFDRKDRWRKAFADTLTLPAVVKTLLRCREAYAHRAAFAADSLAEVADLLRAVTAESGDAKRLRNRGIYVGTVDVDPLFGQLAEDHDYLLRLIAAGQFDRVATLWTLGFPIDWQIVHPELDKHLPVYLPPTRPKRQRFWPEPPETSRSSGEAMEFAIAAGVVPNLGEMDRSHSGIHVSPGAPDWVARSMTNVIERAPEDSEPVSGSASLHTESGAATFVVNPVGIREKSAAEVASEVVVRSGSVPVAAQGLSCELAELPPMVRRQRLRTLLQGWIAETLAYPANEMPAVDAGFFDLGMSSIHLMQVRAAISEELGFEPSETSGFDHPTITEFVDYLDMAIDFDAVGSTFAVSSSSSEVKSTVTGVAATAPELPNLDAASIDRLSAVELERVLTQIL
jgi:acyl transferase domain-containing protein